MAKTDSNEAAQTYTDKGGAMSPCPKQSAFDDLQITIWPRAYTQYHGSAEQLIAEGLIPKDFEWPKRDARVSYEIGEFSYWMGRSRPEGMKGPMSMWVNGDYWFLRRSLSSLKHDGWRAADIHEKMVELAKVMRRDTPEWRNTCNLAYKAQQEPKYAAFRNLLMGPEKLGRGRPSKQP